MPAALPRSTATSGAHHVGTRSSWNDSSCSSITTTAESPAHPARTADRAPITTSTPARAASTCPGSSAVVSPRRRREAAPRRAILMVGHTTSTVPSAAAACTTDSADTSGGTSSTPPADGRALKARAASSST